MSDEIFRPQRPANGNDPAVDLPEHHPLRHQANQFNQGDGPVKITGNVPPQFRTALGMDGGNQNPQPNNFQNAPQPGMYSPQGFQTDPELAALLQTLRGNSSNYEKIVLPSRGRFYDGTDGPVDGVLHIRPMTGEEEQILATPRFVKKGVAVNMIFSKCIQEPYKPENFLTADRTFLLIYLRGISYGSDYEVQVKCPETDKPFQTSIDLDSVEVERCPDNFSANDLTGILPVSKQPYSYRLSRGRDELEIQEHRERKLKAFGDNAVDDTLLFRTAQLVENIGKVTDKESLKIVLKNLMIQDVSHLRNLVNDPPFGVNTKVTIISPYTNEEFEIDLPLEANFFFPKNKKVTNTQA
jgi:hypothetical protein